MYITTNKIFKEITKPIRKQVAGDLDNTKGDFQIATEDIKGAKYHYSEKWKLKPQLLPDGKIKKTSNKTSVKKDGEQLEWHTTLTDGSIWSTNGIIYRS